MVAGSKGGVGKTTTVLGIVDQQLALGKTILLVETDTSNPDAWRSLQADTALESSVAIEGVKMIRVKLEKSDGWVSLIDAIHENPDRLVVISTAARTNTAVERHGELLHSVLDQLNRQLITLWLINAQLDSLELLKEHMAVFPNSTTHVVRNFFFGEEEGDFELYNGSKVRTTIESGGGHSLNMPVLTKRVADAVFNERMCISQAAKKLPLGHLSALRQWTRATSVEFSKVLAS